MYCPGATAFHFLPVIVGFALGCALGAASEEALGLRSLALLTALARLAVVLARLPAPEASIPNLPIGLSQSLRLS